VEFFVGFQINNLKHCSFILANPRRAIQQSRDHPLNQQIITAYNSEIYTPVKAVKGMADVIKKRDKAANDLFSTAVSRVRQPIEAFFNWLIEKVDIQKAGKVRSTKGLLIHVFGRLAAAFLNFKFNP